LIKAPLFFRLYPRICPSEAKASATLADNKEARSLSTEAGLFGTISRRVASAEQGEGNNQMPTSEVVQRPLADRSVSQAVVVYPQITSFISSNS